MVEDRKPEPQKPFIERQNLATQFLIKHNLLEGEENKPETVKAMIIIHQYDEKIPGLSTVYVDFINSFARLEGLLNDGEIASTFNSTDRVIEEFIGNSEKIFEEELARIPLKFVDPKAMADEMGPALGKRLTDLIITNPENEKVFKNKGEMELAIARLLPSIIALSYKAALELSKEYFSKGENRIIKTNKGEELETINDYGLNEAFGEVLTNEFLQIESVLVLKFFNDASFAIQALGKGEDGELHREIGAIVDRHVEDFENNEQLQKLFKGNGIQFDFAEHHFYNELNEVVTKLTGKPLEFSIDFGNEDSNN